MYILISATVPARVNIVVYSSGSVNDIEIKNSLNLTHAVKMGKFNYLGFNKLLKY